MKVGTANIQNTPDLAAWKVRADVLTIWRWMRGWVLFGWQEIGEEADDRAIKNVFSWARGYRHLFFKRATPISVRRTVWAVTDHYWNRAHGGMAGISPNRGYSVALLKHRLRLRGLTLAFICTHMVSKAWSDPDASHKSWRRARWIEHWAEMTEHIAKLNSQGITAIVVGDLNINLDELRPMLPANAKVVAHNWYDYIIVFEAAKGIDVTVKSEGHYKGKMHTDHNPVYANLDLKRKAA
jgi:hypothetical protein